MDNGQVTQEEGEGIEDFYDSVSSDYSGTETLSWISWYCSLLGHEYFAEIPEDFIEDDFNLCGLSSVVPYYEEALDTILDVEPDDAAEIEKSAERLYGLIHQRYIQTRAGIIHMKDKYSAAKFGSCPRFYCNNIPILPCGLSDVPGKETVRLFCPNCGDLYNPPSSRYTNLDGSSFGTTFAHLFFQFCTDVTSNVIAKHQPKIYDERIFGFKISKHAVNGARMKWLRLFDNHPFQDKKSNGDSSHLNNNLV